MGFIGGDLIEITYNHPTVGDGVFYVKSGEDTKFDPGGIRNDDDIDSVAGNGVMILKKNRKRWSLEAPIAWDMNDNNEIEVLEQLSESPLLALFTMSHINGTVWAGVGTIVGDIAGATQEANIPLKISGGGKASKVVG